MTRSRVKTLPSLAAVALGSLIGGTGAADARCYEVVGCVDETVFPESFLMKEGSCDVLWEIRNGVYARHGYCFSSDRGIDTFGVKNCSIYDQNAVPMNNYERANVAAIMKVERIKSCR